MDDMKLMLKLLPGNTVVIPGRKQFTVYSMLVDSKAKHIYSIAPIRFNVDYDEALDVVRERYEASENIGMMNRGGEFLFRISSTDGIVVYQRTQTGRAPFAKPLTAWVEQNGIVPYTGKKRPAVSKLNKSISKSRGVGF